MEYGIPEYAFTRSIVYGSSLVSRFFSWTAERTYCAWHRMLRACILA
jgi:hypothetical protein